MKFRKKPVVIDAECWDGNNHEAIVRLSATSPSLPIPIGDGRLMCHTLEGVMMANPGDWIIRGVKAELYPCKPDIFEATYEAVNP